MKVPFAIRSLPTEPRVRFGLSAPRLPETWTVLRATAMLMAFSRVRIDRPSDGTDARQLRLYA